MYKTVKIPEESYLKAKSLSKELEKSKELVGVSHVSLSNAISYAIIKTLENLKKRHKLISSAGGWSDMDTKKLIRDIYESRKVSARAEVEL